MILITGASGNVGGETLKQAAAAGLSLRAAYQSRAKAESAPRGVETVLLDYARPATIRPALKGIATVFLVSPAVANLAELETNVTRECGPAGVTQIVKLRPRRPPGDFPEPALRLLGADRAFRRRVHVSSCQRLHAERRRVLRWDDPV